MRKSPRSSPNPSAGFSDRGPAKYFHGRKEILSGFGKLLLHANQDIGGTTFLIQGAPGVGKTALLAECERLALDRSWKTAEIDPPALWDPNELLHYLGMGSRLRVTGGSGEVGVNVGAKAGAKVDVSVDRPRRTTLNILRDGNKPLLLILDEAQALGMAGIPPSDKVGVVNSVLNNIHNGRLRRPVILLAAGLGTTVNAFMSFQISRFNKKCLIELGALDEESERAVIRDWLEKGGGAKGDSSAWIDAIARETHGWPQHILSYVDPAVEQMNANRGVMTAEGLNAVLDAGRELRSEYYERRAHDFSRIQRSSLAKLMADDPFGKGLDEENILQSLTQEYGADKAEKLFHRALHCGILHKRRGRYTVPIPSMQDWLVSQYASGYDQLIYNQSRPAGRRV